MPRSLTIANVKVKPGTGKGARQDITDPGAYIRHLRSAERTHQAGNKVHGWDAKLTTLTVTPHCYGLMSQALKLEHEAEDAG